MKLFNPFTQFKAPTLRRSSRPIKQSRGIEVLEQRIAPAALPIATISAPNEALIGEQFTFTVKFDNAGADIGYGPYIDLILPTSGKDGNGSSNVDDGISFVSASTFGISLPPLAQAVPGLGGLSSFVHSIAKDLTGAAVNLTAEVTGYQDGDRVVTLRLPFGSFSPNEPEVSVQVTVNLSHLADTGASNALNIRAVAGFEFGMDALANPTLPDPTIIGAAVNASVTPALFTLKKTYLGLENETVTGPNFAKDYRIDVDVATGQTITDLVIRDVLSSNMQFVSGGNLLGAGSSIIPSSTSLVGAIGGKGGTVTIATPSNTTITGALGVDASYSFKFFIPLTDAANAQVLNPVTADDGTSTDDASTQGKWVPIDSRDHVNGPNVPVIVTSDIAPNDHTLSIKSIAIQKSVAQVGSANVGPVGYSPGDLVQYTLNVQVSDFFAFDEVRAFDTLGDGLVFASGNPVTLSVQGNGFTYSGQMSAFTSNPGSGGTTNLTFDISTDLNTHGVGTSKLVGGLVNPTTPFGFLTGLGDGPTTAQITFFATIADRFTSNAPSGDFSVDHGDLLFNDVRVQGVALKTSDLRPSAPIQLEDDSSGAVIQIPNGELRKTVFAINGNQVFSNPPSIDPGDLVTFRIEYDLPNTDSDGLRFEDFLPKPIFDVSSTSPTNPTFGFNLTGGIPVNGFATFNTLSGPNAFTALFPGLSPTVLPNPVDNSVQFLFDANFPDNGNPTGFGAFDLTTATHGTNAQASKVDILFTVTATNAPFADGLFLTNLAHSDEGTTNNGTISQNAIVQVKMKEPNVKITKGVIDTDSPSEEFNSNIHIPAGVTFTNGALTSGTINSTNLHPGGLTMLTSGVDGVDGYDKVTFAIVLENVGAGSDGAFDVKIKENFPAGFVVPSGGINLQVFDGTGSAVAYTNVSSGTGLFGAGIELTDGATTGALDPLNPTSGNNIVIVTYCLEVDSRAVACRVLPNTATLFNYTNVEGGTDFTQTDVNVVANTTIRCPELTKAIATTSEAHTTFKGGFEQVTIGEIIRYRLEVELPEGSTPQLYLLDNLPAGLKYLPGNETFAVVSNNGFSGVPSGAQNTGSSPANLANSIPINSTSTTSGAFSLPYNFFNSDNDANKEFAVIEFNALVENVISNQAGTKLANTFQAFTFFRNEDIRPIGDPSPAVEVCVVEPRLFNFGKTAGVAMGDAGDAVPFKLSFTAGNGLLDTAAFDVRLTDNLAPYFNLGSVLVKRNGVLMSTGFSNLSAGGIADVSIDRVNPGDHIEVTLNTIVSNQVAPCQNIENEAHFSYTSLPGANGTIPNPTGGSTPGNSGDANGERNGMDGIGGLNNYVGEACTTFSVNCPTIAKTVVKTSNPLSKSGQFNPKITDLLHGEIVTYQVSFILPEGTSPDTVLTDILPYGAAGELAAVSAKVVGIGTGIAGATLSAGSSAALSDANTNGFLDTATFDFGDLTVAGTSAARTITVEVKAQVTAASANIAGKLLTNTATLSTAYGSATATANAEVITRFRNGGPFGQVNLDPNLGGFTLDVEGTPAGDTIAVNADPVSGLTSLIVNGTNYIYPANISRINVFGGDGDDTISADKALTIPVYFNGGNGNDKLTGGAAADMLLGGEGKDLIDGGLGNDLVFGGAGSDRLRGSGGQDILVAARTVFDNDWEKLDAISKVWANGSSEYSAKIAQLSNGITVGELELQLNASSIIADEGRNTLDGGGDADWWIAASPTRDTYVAKAPEETVTITAEALRSLVSTKLLRAMVAR